MIRTLVGASRIILLETLAYRSMLFFWAICDATYPLALIAVWLVVYQGQSTVAGLTEAQMLLYYLGVLIVTTTVSVHSEWDISENIRSGYLRFHLTKPFPYALYIVIDAFIWRINSAWISVPIAFFVVWLANTYLGLAAPYPVSWQFLLALIGSFGIFASMSIFIGFTAFFLDRINGIIHANGIVRSLASGYLLPLALFPDWAQQLLNVLPYRYLFDFPVSALIGTISTDQFWQGVGIQAAWALFFAIGATFLWHVGIRRYDAPEQVGSGGES